MVRSTFSPPTTAPSLANRLVVSEQPSDRWLLAMAAYCQAGTDKLRDGAEFYARGHRTSDDDQSSYFGQLAGAQQAGESFAEHLQDRFAAVITAGAVAKLASLPRTFHPGQILFHEVIAMVRDVRRAPTLRAKLEYVLAPGWSHDGSSHTARELRITHQRVC